MPLRVRSTSSRRAGWPLFVCSFAEKFRVVAAGFGSTASGFGGFGSSSSAAFGAQQVGCYLITLLPFASLVIACQHGCRSEAGKCNQREHVSGQDSPAMHYFRREQAPATKQGFLSFRTCLGAGTTDVFPLPYQFCLRVWLVDPPVVRRCVRRTCFARLWISSA